MSITALGSTFGQLPPSRAARETAELVDKVVETQIRSSAAATLKSEAATIAAGPTLANSSGLDRIAARIADGALAIQEGQQAPPPRSAAKSYTMVAGAGG